MSCTAVLHCALACLPFLVCALGFAAVLVNHVAVAGLAPLLALCTLAAAYVAYRVIDWQYRTETYVFRPGSVTVSTTSFCRRWETTLTNDGIMCILCRTESSLDAGGAAADHGPRRRWHAKSVWTACYLQRRNWTLCSMEFVLGPGWRRKSQVPRYAMCVV